MTVRQYLKIVKSYKSCPKCGASWKGNDLQCELNEETAHIFCTCGFSKYVDKNNVEVKVN